MTLTNAAVLTTAIVALAAAPSEAQQPTDEEINDYIELARMDIRQGRADLIGQHMQLSAGQAAEFWPIYEQYEQAFTALGDEEVQVIRDYARSYEAMTDATASDLAKRALDIDRREHELLVEYHGKIESALGGAVGARFMQVERRIQMLLDLQLAADIPLLEPPR